MNRIIYFIAVFGAAIFLISVNFCQAGDSKEDVVSYIKEVSSIITNVDITIRGIGFNTLPMQEGVKRLNSSIGQLSFMECPPSMSKQHKTVLLAFKKIRAGLLLFSLEKKDTAVGLIKNGIRLLKYAAKDILAIAEREGIRKPADRSVKKGE
jgi:hypothetical protein